MEEKTIGPKVDRIETTPDMVWPSNEGRLNVIEEEIENNSDPG